MVLSKVLFNVCYQTTMISSSALHVGRHGSTHSLQQIHLSAARNLQQASSPDSPQISPRRHHDTITEGEESANSEDGNHVPTADVLDEGAKSNNDPITTQHPPVNEQTHKKGSITSRKDRR